MSAGRRAWSEAERDYMREHFADTPTAEIARALGRKETLVSQCAKRLGLKKSATYLASPAACRLRRGGNIGAACRFKKGQSPWNNGMKGYDAGGRSVETRFKRGHRGGIALKKHQPIGTERISKDGIRQRKVNDDFPLQARWKAVHAIVWEEARGPVPDGHFIRFKDGNRENIVLDNLELISRAENMRRNTVHQWGKEIAQLYRLRGAVTRQIKKRAKP